MLTWSTEDFVKAHGTVWAGRLRYRSGRCLEDLAAVLLERGPVPGPDEYDGEWWLWWPKKGHGPCRDCRQRWSLTRYSAIWGDEYRYLCARCRENERDHISELAARFTDP
jgi:hypothetical protein